MTVPPTRFEISLAEAQHLENDHKSSRVILNTGDPPRVQIRLYGIPMVLHREGDHAYVTVAHDIGTLLRNLQRVSDNLTTIYGATPRA